MRVFIFGLGFSGRAVARRLVSRGVTVGGSERDPARRASLLAEGIAAAGFPVPDSALSGLTHVLSTVPPGTEGDPVLAAHGSALRAARLQWTGYLSTTGVYGDSGGAWVDETTPPRPGVERSRRRLAAEGDWRALGAHVFRLAGIYGPGRSAFDQLRAGRAHRYDKPGQVFGRVHVEDVAGAVEASIARPCPGAIYNVCDDEPAPPQDVIAEAAALLGMAPPPLEPFDTAKLSPMAASFYEENRRVRNDLIKRELGFRPAFPTYREGLRAILAAGG